MESRHLIAVVGASGSGKSSVARAGLLPRLRHHQEGQPVYEIATMVPGERPLLRLAAALVPLLEPGMVRRAVSSSADLSTKGIIPSLRHHICSAASN